MSLPDRPPFVLRARVLTPLAAGGTADFPDGIVIVGAGGSIAWVGSAADWRGPLSDGSPALGGSPGDEADLGAPIDLRPLVLLPGMVDLHAHLPQLPNAGLGAGLNLMTWLDCHNFPLERRFVHDEEAARHAPATARTYATTR